MDDLNAILQFVRVVQAGSFAGAARRLGMSPSQLSKQIARLEQQLGTRLLNRTTRSLSLTEAGSIFHGHGMRIVEELDSSREAVQRLQSEPAGCLRISALPSLCHYVLTPLLPQWLARYPSLDIELVASERVIDLAEEGFDLALRITPEPPPGVVARRLAAIRYQLCASPGYLANKGRPDSVADLASHDLIGYGRNLPVLWQFADGSTARHWRYRFSANSVHALQELALRDGGIALLPTYAAHENMRNGRLVEVLPGSLALNTHALYAIYLPNRYGSPKIRSVIEQLAATIGTPPAWDMPAR